MDLSDQLSLGFESRRKQPTDFKFEIPLREGDFCHEICGEFCAMFEEDYIIQLRNIVGGDIKIFIAGLLKGGITTHHNKGKVYLNETTVDYILTEIDYFEKNNKWRECNEDNVSEVQKE